MAVALQVSDDSDVRVSEEAFWRIASARQREVAFLLRQISPTMDVDDAACLAAIFVQAENNNQPLSKRLVVEGLRRQGRSEHKIEQLSKAIFK